MRNIAQNPTGEACNYRTVCHTGEEDLCRLLRNVNLNIDTFLHSILPVTIQLPRQEHIHQYTDEHTFTILDSGIYIPLLGGVRHGTIAPHSVPSILCHCVARHKGPASGQRYPVRSRRRLASAPPARVFIRKCRSFAGRYQTNWRVIQSFMECNWAKLHDN